jgi:hypothetical protein
MPWGCLGGGGGSLLLAPSLISFEGPISGIQGAAENACARDGQICCIPPGGGRAAHCNDAGDDTKEEKGETADNEPNDSAEQGKANPSRSIGFAHVGRLEREDRWGW